MNGPPYKMVHYGIFFYTEFPFTEAVQRRSLSLVWLASQAEELEHQRFIASNGLHAPSAPASLRSWRQHHHPGHAARLECHAP